MESELSGIFRIKLVTKNIVRGSPGTQFMHMRVNETKKKQGLNMWCWDKILNILVIKN